MMKYLFIALLSLPLMVGCASKPKEVVKLSVVEVKIPVATPCQVNVPDKPAYVTINIASNDTIFAKMQALLSDRVLSLVYEKELEDILAVCTAP